MLVGWRRVGCKLSNSHQAFAVAVARSFVCHPVGICFCLCLLPLATTARVPHPFRSYRKGWDAKPSTSHQAFPLLCGFRGLCGGRVLVALSSPKSDKGYPLP